MTRSADAYTYIRGETFSFILEFEEGDETGFDTANAVCQMKLAVNGRYAPDSSVPATLTLATSFIAASGEDKARWSFTATDEQTAQLEPGVYILDAHLPLTNGGVEKTDPILLVVSQNVSDPA